MIFLFLRNRATAIRWSRSPCPRRRVHVHVPLRFSVNTLTHSDGVAIGLVDDAIVVLENIYRHLEEGMSRLDAALLGAREIAFAVIAMTITLAAVFAPLAFQTGRTGRLFIEFALALAGAVLVSGFVALTLSPMMCSKLSPRPNGRSTTRSRILSGAHDGGLQNACTGCNRMWMIAFWLAVVASAGPLFSGCATARADRAAAWCSASSPRPRRDRQLHRR